MGLERFRHLRSAIPLGLAVLTGCGAERTIQATTVLHHEHCHGLAAGITQVAWSDVDALRQSDRSGDAAAGTGERDDDLLLFAISRGEQPTGGYELRLEASRLEPGTAVIDIHWSAPPADAMVTQVITHPCLVVGLPRQDLDGLERLEVRDQHGTVVGSTTH